MKDSQKSLSYILLGLPVVSNQLDLNALRREFFLHPEGSENIFLKFVRFVMQESIIAILRMHYVHWRPRAQTTRIITWRTYLKISLKKGWVMPL